MTVVIISVYGRFHNNYNNNKIIIIMLTTTSYSDNKMLALSRMQNMPECRRMRSSRNSYHLYLGSLSLFVYLENIK
jgi:hypothetical protein